MTGSFRARLAAPHRVLPHQAIGLAPATAGAFAKHGQRRRLLAASVALAFLFGGGRQHHGASLTLWRVWPRWSTPPLLAVISAGILALVSARPALPVAVAGYLTVLAVAIAALLRAAAGWTGLPAGCVMIGDVANAGPPGAGRDLLTAVCAEADHRKWTLTLAVRQDQTKVIGLYRDLHFVPLAARNSHLIMVRPIMVRPIMVRPAQH